MARILTHGPDRRNIGGRAGVRRCLVGGLVALFAVGAAVGPVAAGNSGSPPVSVREDAGVYYVEAGFDVPQPPPLVIAVLTDYEQIPRFMPDVRTSTVRERAPGRAVVEQEAVASLMMFSRRIRLLLTVDEGRDTLHFRDMSGHSFERYEGCWQVQQHDGRTAIRYRLTARPNFSVPEFLLKRLLLRDAKEMIERLRREIAARTPITTDEPATE